MVRNRLFLLFTFLLFGVSAGAINAQPSGVERIAQLLDQYGCTDLEAAKVKLCKSDFESGGFNVEAISFRPTLHGTDSQRRFPGVLLIPGYQRTARDLISLGIALAREGFASLAVTQPGFGRSTGKADYVGPATIKALSEGYERLKRETYVDQTKLGIYGYSRGGMAASLLAVQLDDVRAVVLGAGIYDFKRAYDEMTIEGIKRNMLAETGMTLEAVKVRSSILQMKKLKCPVLILHGEKDVNVPVSQAKLLSETLTSLKKDFELKLYPDKDHSIGPDATTSTIDFFKRKLMSASTRQ
ncbi:MAG TPA: prolyl oligopeptidase family serine peptidase [Pyrinomonadaceae bacterium]|jgi:dipeptidyl aminopeptidase/acylaminoacyl peptidase